MISFEWAEMFKRSLNAPITQRTRNWASFMTKPFKMCYHLRFQSHWLPLLSYPTSSENFVSFLMIRLRWNKQRSNVWCRVYDESNFLTQFLSKFKFAALWFHHWHSYWQQLGRRRWMLSERFDAKSQCFALISLMSLSNLSELLKEEEFIFKQTRTDFQSKTLFLIFLTDWIKVVEELSS